LWRDLGLRIPTARYRCHRVLIAVLGAGTISLRLVSWPPGLSASKPEEFLSWLASCRLGWCSLWREKDSALGLQSSSAVKVSLANTASSNDHHHVGREGEPEAWKPFFPPYPFPYQHQALRKMRDIKIQGVGLGCGSVVESRPILTKAFRKQNKLGMVATQEGEGRTAGSNLARLSQKQTTAGRW
jgi:hypothetical protein